MDGFLHTLARKCGGSLRKLQMRFCHENALKRESARHGLHPDLRNPLDINEKILWLLCHTYGKDYSRYADKLAVRDYLAEKGFGELCVPLLGVWERAEDIDFGSLPGRFVLKCNHDSGSSLILDKGSEGFDEKAVRDFYRAKLTRKFGYNGGELYYNAIKPRILAEPFLQAPEGHSSIPDYKVWCFDGRPYCIWACTDRSGGTVRVRTYDTRWEPVPGADRPTGHYLAMEGDLPRPAFLSRMLEATASLSEGFPEVRVDFYEAEGRLFFSEMTLASYAGQMDFYTPEFLLELGRQCILPL